MSVEITGKELQGRCPSALCSAPSVCVFHSAYPQAIWLTTLMKHFRCSRRAIPIR
jgi:hypothetical protein